MKRQRLTWHHLHLRWPTFHEETRTCGRESSSPKLPPGATARENPSSTFAQLASETDAAEAAEETFSFQGATYTPMVAISDASGGDGGLIEVTVTIGQVSLKTRKGEY